jgi:hypothetical protein
MRAKDSRDLAIASGAALLSLLLVALPFGGLAKGLALAPLVLFLPGYALTAAFFPPGALPRAERFVYSISLSVGAAALGGLIWQLAFDLGRYAWAGLLTAIVLLASEAARRRRAPQPRRASGERLPRPGLAAALAILAAVAVAAIAVALAIGGVRDQRAESHFSALWVVPARTGAGAVEIGVLNHQGASHDYRIEASDRGATVWHWHGRLGATQRKEVVLDSSQIPARARLAVSLYRDGVVYRRTELQVGGAP